MSLLIGVFLEILQTFFQDTFYGLACHAKKMDLKNRMLIVYQLVDIVLLIQVILLKIIKLIIKNRFQY